MIESKNPFIDPIAIDGGRDAQELAEISRANIENSVVTKEFAVETGVAGLKDVVEQEADVAREKGLLGSAALNKIVDHERREHFEKAFESKRMLYERIGLIMPTPEDFENEGMDFAALAERFPEMGNTDFPPEIVITPRYLDFGAWSKLYKDLANDKSLPTSYLYASGLDIDRNAIINWTHLEEQAINESNDMQLVDASLDDDMHRPAWSLRLIPSGQTGDDLGIASNGEAWNPSISEYLAVQAGRIQVGKTPLDYTFSETWLAGTLNNEEAMFAGKFYDNHVSIQPYPVGREYRGIGTRRAVAI